MNTQNPDMIASMEARRVLKQRVPVPQFQGIQDGVIVDSDRTNPTVNPQGMCRVTLPNYSGDQVLGPIPYSGAYCPPNGTECTVGYVPPTANSKTAVNSLRVLSYPTWSGQISVTGSQHEPVDTGGFISSAAPALTSLIQALATLGIIVDNTTS